MSHWYSANMEEVDHRPLFPDKFDLKGRTWEDFCRGEPIFDWEGSAWCAVTHERHEGRPDDALWNGLWIPIYSARLRSALTQAGISGVQYLPIEVHRLDGSCVPGYAIANVLNFLPILDLDLSDYIPFHGHPPAGKGDMMTVLKPVLRKTALEGHDVIRPRECHTDLYVSVRFKRVFKDGGFTGYTFRRLTRS